MEVGWRGGRDDKASDNEGKDEDEDNDEDEGDSEDECDTGDEDGDEDEYDSEDEVGEDQDHQQVHVRTVAALREPFPNHAEEWRIIEGQEGNSCYVPFNPGWKRWK